ncbi:hypothetical protein QFW77_02620 [Luteimonas sp. RD2P54]|uniref:DUF4281 domain-containing protein n=1 Tax=Luteimonas endophytica TaxID=3042023 RepID=A0ABT6J504_9GAMM|nr:hypothetical protein [Luteimonas endophytica]MDH5821889.1 hypothetical protein [Luteimonas endophytica]
MEEFLAPDVWPLIAIAMVWWLLSLFPVLYPALVSFRRRATMPQKCLFTCVVACLSYGLLAFLLVVGIALRALAVYIAPQLEVAGDLPAAGRWLAQASGLISAWWWVAVPLVLAMCSFLLTRYLAPRWPPIAAALGPTPHFKGVVSGRGSDR